MALDECGLSCTQASLYPTPHLSRMYTLQRVKTQNLLKLVLAEVCNTCATVANQDKLESGNSFWSGLAWESLRSCVERPVSQASSGMHWVDPLETIRNVTKPSNDITAASGDGMEIIPCFLLPLRYSSNDDWSQAHIRVCTQAGCSMQNCLQGYALMHMNDTEAAPGRVWTCFIRPRNHLSA